MLDQYAEPMLNFIVDSIVRDSLIKLRACDTARWLENTAPPFGGIEETIEGFVAEGDGSAERAREGARIARPDCDPLASGRHRLQSFRTWQ
jgi:hypothetical protein